MRESSCRTVRTGSYSPGASPGALSSSSKENSHVVSKSARKATEFKLGKKAHVNGLGRGAVRASSSRAGVNGTSCFRVASVFERRANPAFSRIRAPSLPLISAALCRTPSRLCHCVISLIAVFSPTPGDAGDIVSGVAHQRLHLDHASRLDAEFRLHFGRARGAGRAWYRACSLALRQPALSLYPRTQ